MTIIKNKIRLRYFREEATSTLAGFHQGPLSWSNWNLAKQGKNCKTLKIINHVPLPSHTILNLFKENK